MYRTKPDGGDDDLGGGFIVKGSSGVVKGLYRSSGTYSGFDFTQSSDFAGRFARLDAFNLAWRPMMSVAYQC